jgi:hypothetical protein
MFVSQVDLDDFTGAVDIIKSSETCMHYLAVQGFCKPEHVSRIKLVRPVVRERDGDSFRHIA